MRRFKTQQGFVPLLILVVVVLVAIIALVSWHVWGNDEHDRSSSSDPTSKKVTQSDSRPNETDNWASVTTQGEAFSMKVPDGWKVTNYPDNFLGSIDVKYTSGARAVIETVDTAYAGHALHFRANITPLDDAGLGPQWPSPQEGLTESSMDFYIGTLKGKRFKGVFSTDGQRTLYEYVFGLKNNQKLDIVYSVPTSSAGERASNSVDVVEKAIKTITIH